MALCNCFFWQSGLKIRWQLVPLCTACLHCSPSPRLHYCTRMPEHHCRLMEFFRKRRHYLYINKWGDILAFCNLCGVSSLWLPCWLSHNRMGMPTETWLCCFDFERFSLLLCISLCMDQGDYEIRICYSSVCYCENTLYNTLSGNVLPDFWSCHFGCFRHKSVFLIQNLLLRFFLRQLRSRISSVVFCQSWHIN